MKYKIINTDIQLNNKLHNENSEVELTKEQTKGIEEYLVPINNGGHSSPDAESSKQKKKFTRRSLDEGGKKGVKK